MKNGEEVVSVGGAVDPSLKNVGTSASNSVLLDLGKVGVRGWTHSLNLSDIVREIECGCSCCEAGCGRLVSALEKVPPNVDEVLPRLELHIVRHSK